MIIEIRDLPAGASIKSINCSIDFNDGGTQTVAVEPKIVEPKPKPQPAPEPETRPEKIAPEMQDLEF